MSEKDSFIDLGKINNAKVKSKKHTPSSIQADTLFTFMNCLDYLIQIINTSMVSPRYCVEDISYLKLRKIKKIAYPMKCFCDINLHKMNEHLQWYGYYGLAFSKEWGMKNQIQPIQYINPDSELRADFTNAFQAALDANLKKEPSSFKKLKSYLFHEMMYYKPYEGKIKNRNTEKIETKCFTDECEWRFIPNVKNTGYKLAYFQDNILNDGLIEDISNSMIGNKDVSLCFDYSDIKYIIIKDNEDLKHLTNAIENLDILDEDKHLMLSKIIIWNNSKGDF